MGSAVTADWGVFRFVGGLKSEENRKAIIPTHMEDASLTCGHPQSEHLCPAEAQVQPNAATIGRRPSGPRQHSRPSAVSWSVYSLLGKSQLHGPPAFILASWQSSVCATAWFPLSPHTFNVSQIKYLIIHILLPVILPCWSVSTRVSAEFLWQLCPDIYRFLWPGVWPWIFQHLGFNQDLNFVFLVTSNSKFTTFSG